MSALDYCKLAGREPSPALNAAAAEFSSQVGRIEQIEAQRRTSIVESRKMELEAAEAVVNAYLKAKQPTAARWLSPPFDVPQCWKWIKVDVGYVLLGGSDAVARATPDGRWRVFTRPDVYGAPEIVGNEADVEAAKAVAENVARDFVERLARPSAACLDPFETEAEVVGWLDGPFNDIPEAAP